MTRLEALRELALKVEAGKWWEDIGICSSFCAKSGFTGRQATLMSNVMRNGSLDAAKALHEALLPGWSATVWTYSGDDADVSVTKAGTGITKDAEVEGDNPARAWLLAILKALIAQEEIEI